MAFFCKNEKQCSVTLMAGNLIFHYRQRSRREVTAAIPYSSIVKVDDDSSAAASSQPCCPEHVTATVHYVRQASNRRLRIQSLSVRFDAATCRALRHRLRQETAVAERPKRLLVFINPNSGKKRAVEVFNNRVQPVFHMCGIRTSVLVTSAAKEACDLLQTVDLTDVDGVVTVGGDGLFSEVMNGLLLRTQKDHGVNAHDPQAKVVPTQIPIGIIPAGSGDWVARYLHGTRDVTTAALRVVLGNTSLSNAASVHQGGKLSAYAGLLLAFGLQGDMMHDCEKFRWMGPRRYSVIPIGTLLNRRTYDVEVEYQNDVTGELTRISDRMYSVDTYVISKAEQGDKLVPMFGDSALSVYTTSKCSLGKHVQQLAEYYGNKAGCFHHDFMTSSRVQSYKVRFPRASLVCKGREITLKEKYYLNCDGEVLQVTRPEYQVKLHRQAVRMFGLPPDGPNPDTL